MPRRISARNGVQPGKSTRRRIRSGQMVPEGRAFGRGQRRGVHPVGREKQCGAQVIRFPDEGGIFMTAVRPSTGRGSEFLYVGGVFSRRPQDVADLEGAERLGGREGFTRAGA